MIVCDAEVPSYDAMNYEPEQLIITRPQEVPPVAPPPDVEPPEVVAHLPILCEERNIPYLFAPTKDKIGEVLGVQLPTAAACIIEAGESQELLDQIIPKLKEQISTG